MKDFKTRFERTEKKYLLTQSDFNYLEEVFRDHLTADDYPVSHIRNIYFDDDRYDVIGQSIERRRFKEKLRVRSYCDEKAFIEIKRKFKGKVYKRRIAVTTDEAYGFCFDNVIPEKEKTNEKQIVKEIEYFLKLHDCGPMMYLAYDRLSFKGTTDQGLRITFDTDVRYRTWDLSFDDNGGEIYILGKGMPVTDQDGRQLCGMKYIMEIKADGAMPAWLIRALNERKIYPASFSKYGNCYINMMRGERKHA